MPPLVVKPTDFYTYTDTHQAKTHPSIIEDSHLPLIKWPRILGVYLDLSLSFNKHSKYLAESTRQEQHL